MRTLRSTFMALALAAPVASLAASWQDVSLMDGMCLSKFKGKNPDDHDVSCLMQCQGSGYGIITADGKYLEFDKAGNAKALAALKATKKKNHIRVDVTGEQKGDTIQVSSLRIP